MRLLHIFLIYSLCTIAVWARPLDNAIDSLTLLSLPQVRLEFDADTTTHEHFIDGRITIAEYGKDTITHNCQIRRRGKTALFLPKKAYAIKLVDENGDKVDDNLLGLRTDNSWILDAMGIDHLRMRNRVLFDIWNEFSHTCWNTKFNNRNGTVGKMVEVYVKGEYFGIYCLSDKVNRKLLNLSKAKENNDSTITIKGLMYKGNCYGLSNNLLDYEEDRTDTLQWNTFELQYPDDYPCAETWQPLMDLIDFNGKTTFEDFVAHYTEWYYVDNLVDYWIFLMAFGLDDMPYKNTFLSTPDINIDHRYMITPWDLDACLGRTFDGKENPYPTKISHLNTYAPFNLLLPYNIDGFKSKIARRWFELIENELSPSNLEFHIRSFAQQFIESGAWQREHERWTEELIAIDENIEDEIQYVMNWYNQNVNSLSQQINRWRDDYVDDTITAATITQIYNYILGIDTEYNEELDLNEDGIISSADITFGYNVILSNESQGGQK